VVAGLPRVFDQCIMETIWNKLNCCNYIFYRILQVDSETV
jgi:hypothetical protein